MSISLRHFRRTFQAWMAAGFILTALPGFCEIEPFTFVHISDTHIGGQGHAARLAEILNDVEENFPDSAFIVNTGDITEFGYVEEFTSYTEVIRRSRYKIYEAIGNHDTRWSENGKENFRRFLGPTYKSFDHKGVRFIMLDVAMLIEQYGHFDGQQLAQLKSDLDALPEDSPAVLAMHHPPLHPRHFIDNEYEFAELIRGYNVPLVCVGHGHSFMRYALNGTTYAMGAAVSTGSPARSYRVYHVSADEIEMVKRNVASDQTTTEPAILLKPSKSGIGDLAIASEGTTASADGELRFKIEDSPARFAEAVYTLDKYSSASASKASGDEFVLNVNAIPSGLHQLVAELSEDSQTSQVRTTYFRSELSTGPRILREWPLESGVQAHPMVDGDVLYVGANDQKLRAIDLVSGELLWEQDLNREILSAPVATSDSIIVGSMDQHVYCLDKQSGAVRWKYKTSGAVLGSPLLVEDVVYIGSGDSHLYALDAASGDLKWSFAAGKAIKATPAFANGRLFFGAWDNHFYCVDANSGELVWKVIASTSTLFSPATFNPVVFEDKVLVVTHDYSVRCLDQKTGSHVWMYKPQKDELGPSYSSAVIRDGVAYMGSINGHVVGHRMSDGKKVFDLAVRPESVDPIFDSLPLLIGDRIYFGSVGGYLYCIDIPKQSVEWGVALQPGYIFTRPAAWRDRILVGSLSDRVFEIGPVAPGQVGDNESGVE